MGLFDEVRCKYPLPLAGANDVLYQTKDTPRQTLDLYEIREDGTLWHEDYDVEDRSDPKAVGMMRLVGILSRVNKRWSQVLFNGDIAFYYDLCDGWLEWKAVFVDGKVTKLERV